MAKLLLKCIHVLGEGGAYLFPMRVANIWNNVLTHLYTGYCRRHFHQWGDSTIAYRAKHLVGLSHVSVGNRTRLGSNIQLTAWTTGNATDNEPPVIVIGDDCHIRDGAHITAISGIRIGNGLLTGTNVLITDNSHGLAVRAQMEIAPILRPLCSKGAVVIGNNVWLGNNVCVMPGVTIGDGAIIGANAVVTKSIPAYSVAVGVPARVIEQQ